MAEPQADAEADGGTDARSADRVLPVRHGRLETGSSSFDQRSDGLPVESSVRSLSVAAERRRRWMRLPWSQFPGPRRNPPAASAESDRAHRQGGTPRARTPGEMPAAHARPAAGLSAFAA